MEKIIYKFTSLHNKNRINTYFVSNTIRAICKVVNLRQHHLSYFAIDVCASTIYVEFQGKKIAEKTIQAVSGFEIYFLLAGCLLAQMCNLSHACDKKGHCACYTGEIHTFYNKTVHEPVCNCPAGSQLKNCGKPYTQIVRSYFLNQTCRKL